MVQATGTSLFLFAHQDDEFGVFQQIASDKLAGRRAICAYLTDGGSDGLRRNQESLRVLQRFDVSADDVYFAGSELQIRDGSLIERLEPAFEWLASWIGCQEALERIYVPAWEGGHPDHDALHALVVTLAHSSQRLHHVRQFPLYNAYRCKGPLFRVFSPLRENGRVEQTRISWFDRIRFVGHCASYPSQVKTWMGLSPFVVFDHLFHGKQRLQYVSPERLSERPHEGRLYYEYRGFDTWTHVCSRVKAIMRYGEQRALMSTHETR